MQTHETEILKLRNPQNREPKTHMHFDPGTPKPKALNPKTLIEPSVSVTKLHIPGTAPGGLKRHHSFLKKPRAGLNAWWNPCLGLGSRVSGLGFRV